MSLLATPAGALPDHPLPAGPRRVYLQTYGCQMNILDSQLVREELVALGYEFTDRAADADVVLLNTCSVRALSEQKVWSALGRLGMRRRATGRPLVGVLGCMAEREAQALRRRVNEVDVVCGPSELNSLPMLLDNAWAQTDLQQRMEVAVSGHAQRRSSTRDRASEAALEALDVGRAAGDGLSAGTQAYVRITRGCNKFCAFCVVPYTRGPEAHRPADHVVQEVRRLVDAGVLEVTLLGQTINHYEYKDGGKTTSFADLLARVHDEVPDLARLRFLTSYPRDFTDDALDVMATKSRMCHYLHIPGQSGSDRILRKMNRGYTVEQYESLVSRARARMPNIRLAGDMIVGYPTETEEDHEASLALLHRTQLKTCYVFKYSPRSGTVAARRLEDDVPNEIKRARNVQMLAVQKEIGFAQNRARIGHRLEILVDKCGDERAWPQAESPSSELVSLPRRRRAAVADAGPTVRLIGRSRGDDIVAFDGPVSAIGSLVHVDIEQATATVLFGTMANAE